MTESAVPNNLTPVTSNPHRWRILAVVATAFFMTILDVSIVNVALPSIGRSLHFTRENLQWVITAYAIAFGGFRISLITQYPMGGAQSTVGTSIGHDFAACRGGRGFF